MVLLFSIACSINSRGDITPLLSQMKFFALRHWLLSVSGMRNSVVTPEGLLGEVGLPCLSILVYLKILNLTEISISPD